ncbi:hypothetical protein JZ785_10065 [Alicyclobacillus curvatus]|nr:hypothetical protein JZ785_10065 [Alicyclobacillus curvatus]
MSEDEDFNQAMQAWQNAIAAQQGQSTQSSSQLSQTDTQSPFQSLGTIDLAKGVQPDHSGSLGVQLMMDSQSTLGVTQHKFSDNHQSIKLTENRVTSESDQENKQD